MNRGGDCCVNERIPNSRACNDKPDRAEEWVADQTNNRKEKNKNKWNETWNGNKESKWEPVFLFTLFFFYQGEGINPRQKWHVYLFFIALTWIRTRYPFPRHQLLQLRKRDTSRIRLLVMDRTCPQQRGVSVTQQGADSLGWRRKTKVGV